MKQLHALKQQLTRLTLGLGLIAGVCYCTHKCSESINENGYGFTPTAWHDVTGDGHLDAIVVQPTSSDPSSYIQIYAVDSLGIFKDEKGSYRLTKNNFPQLLSTYPFPRDLTYHNSKLWLENGRINLHSTNNENGVVHSMSAPYRELKGEQK